MVNDNVLKEQMSLFNLEPQNFKAGEWINKENIGRQIYFDEITQKVGQLIVMGLSTESREWFKVVMVEKIILVENGTQRRLVYYDGKKQRGLVNERYFNVGKYPAKAYELCGSELGVIENGSKRK